MLKGRSIKPLASSGRSAPRGGRRTRRIEAAVGRASVVGRVTLVALSSNCLGFVWPHRSARRKKDKEDRNSSMPRSGWRAVGFGLRLAAPASAADDDQRACRVTRRAWLAGGRATGADSWPVGRVRVVSHHG